MVVDSRLVDSRTDAGNAIARWAVEAGVKFLSPVSSRPLTLGSIGGHETAVHATYSNDAARRVQLVVSLRNVPRTSSTVDVDAIHNAGVGFVSVLENKLRSIPRSMRSVSTGLEEARLELTAVQQRIGAPLTAHRSPRGRPGARRRRRPPPAGVRHGERPRFCVGHASAESSPPRRSRFVVAVASYNTGYPAARWWSQRTGRTVVPAADRANARPLDPLTDGEGPAATAAGPLTSSTVVRTPHLPTDRPSWPRRHARKRSEMFPVYCAATQRP